MPWFSWKQSTNTMNSKQKENKARLEYKLYIAENTPEPIFDLSSCDLDEVPPDIYSLCKVLRKEQLNLSDNKLCDLDDGGNFQNLQQLLVLELQSNRFTHLPSNIGALVNLQVLHVSDNRLRSLPTSFTNLEYLQDLNLSCNKFTEVPHVICNLKSLRNLNLSQNKLKKLTPQLCRLKLLIELNVQDNCLQYPPADVVEQGVEQIMKFLCSASDVDYVPPLECLDNQKFEDLSTDQRRTSCDHQDIREQKRLERLLCEQELDKCERDNTILFADNVARNQKLLREVAEEHDKLDGEIMAIQNDKEKMRKVLLKSLDSVEKRCSSTIEKLLIENEMRKNTETLMKQMEKDQLEIENMLEVRQEEVDKLRKQDVLNAMKALMLAEFELQQLCQNYKQDATVSTPLVEDQDLIKILNSHEEDQKELVSELLLQEKYQREAFESLFMHQDEHRNDIINQIYMIQTELTNVSAMEMSNKDLNQQLKLDILSDKREALAALLNQLMDDRQQRETDIRSQLKALERRHAVEDQDYWLVQYQRLLNKKPKLLVRLESNFDDRVSNLLMIAGADDYIPFFARNKIQFDLLLNMDDTDLLKIGVWDENIRAAILNEINILDKDIKNRPSAPGYDEINICEKPIASAPSISEAASDDDQASSSVPKLWMETECVICMDKKCDVVFLLCGHVCSCMYCSKSLNECPMCRTIIRRKLPLSLAR